MFTHKHFFSHSTMVSCTREILLVSSPDGPITAYDVSTGTILAHFNGSPSSPRKGLALAGNGNTMIAASHMSSDANSGFIHLYNWWSSVPFQRLLVPEPVSPLASGLDGAYLFCGGLSGCIHALALPSGDVLRSFPAHSKPVSCMTINGDSSLLISGGDDGTICVFPILRLLDSSSCEDCNQLALYRFNGHFSPVTGITTGIAGCSSTIISSSLDCTCKFWSLIYGTHVQTLRFPCMIWDIVVDPTESEFYAGGSDGRVYVGVMKVTVRQSMAKGSELAVWSPQHNGTVTAVVMMNEGLNLVSASEDGSVRIWEAESGSMVRVIGNERGSITHLIVAKGVRDCNRLRGTGGFEHGGQSLGCSDREIGKPVREISEMEGMLNVVVKDRRRAIDRLESSIGTYQKFLELIVKEGQDSEGAIDNKENSQG